MDDFEGFGVDTITLKTLRKKRSDMNRRPADESDSSEFRDLASVTSTPSDYVSDAPVEGGNVHSINDQYVSSESYSNLADAETMRKSSNADGVSGEPVEVQKSFEEHPSDNNGRTLNMNANKFNKVKLKVGGITRTICTRSTSSDSSVAGTSSTMSAPSEANCLPPKPSRQDNVDGGKGGLRGVPWKDFLKIGVSFGKVGSSGLDMAEESIRQPLKHGKLHKRKSRSKKHFDDEAYDDEEVDDEIKYLQKLKTSKSSLSYKNSVYGDKTRVKKMRKISKVMDHVDLCNNEFSRSDKQSKKSRSVMFSEDADYLEEEESISDDEIKPKNKKQRKEPIEDLVYPMKESLITTRRRAILKGREISPGLGTSSIEFPDGLPPVPPKKPKEQLTELEQQLKRAEAAERRRIQNEKAARESEAEAIRKILGQDSSRKRREEKIKKRQEELAQERNANAATVASNVVRWVMGPSGTVVTFPNEIGLPSIFETKPSRYPPPREKCAGPSCTNVYKYRDSDSKLPLCSLQCYRAIHEKTKSLSAC